MLIFETIASHLLEKFYVCEKILIEDAIAKYSSALYNHY